MGDIDGDVLDWEIQYQIFLWQKIGLGVGVRSIDIDVEVENEGRLDLGNDGVFWNVVLRL